MYLHARVGGLFVGGSRSTKASQHGGDVTDADSFHDCC